MRCLVVYYNGTKVGVLSKQENIWEFSYADEWQSFADGFDLSPSLPRDERTIKDGSSKRPVQWYFDNLLPEEALRQVVAKEAGLKWEDSFGLLEYYGAESANQKSSQGLATEGFPKAHVVGGGSTQDVDYCGRGGDL